MKEQLFSLLKKIPRGKVTTYKILAKKLKLYPREVARILSKNESLIIVPCHRVVYSNGKVAGYVKDKKEKIKLLKREGIKIVNEKILNFDKFLFRF